MGKRIPTQGWQSAVERWRSPAFLQALADAGDSVADAFAARLLPGQLEAVNRALSEGGGRAAASAAGVPELDAFLALTGKLPGWVDRDRLARGQQVFFTHAFAIGTVLFLKVLPTGYCAPALTRALTVSGDSQARPVRRSLLVLQMLLELCADGAFSGPCASAVFEAQKLRLLHAGVRPIVLNNVPGYVARFGKPVNQEQMLATIVGFSYETVQGLRQLRIGLSAQQEQDFLYLWRVFALVMGIHPEGEPDSTAHVPVTFEEIEAFQAAFRQRHFKPAAENLEGAHLARALLRDIGERLHDELPLPVPFAHHVPRWLAQYFLSADDLARLRMQRAGRASLPIYGILGTFFVWRTWWQLLDALPLGLHLHRWLLGRLLAGIVEVEFGQPPKILVPADKQALKDIVAATANPTSAAAAPASPGGIGSLLAQPFASPQDVEQGLAGLERLLHRKQDRRGVFVTAYIGATRAIRAQLENGGFLDPEWTGGYLVAFANLYREALLAFERGQLREVPQAWRRAFVVAEDDAGLAIQDLLLGINAHVNHDLPLALVQVGIRERREQRHEDHLAVNQALEKATRGIQARVEALYAPGLRVLDLLLGRLDDVFAGFLFERFREDAWRDAVALDDAGHNKATQLAHIERKSAEIAQALAVDTVDDDLWLAALQWVERWRLWKVIVPSS